ncbi:META domain-containing protein [Branchiibius hedensis]|uniref:META domain-containing protein n=1 Tax=Branchiibius hedensis TaxID=672460 RepID=UPI0014745103|nr:META domain-containing protein [Branchiibius hedensis]
MDSLNGKSFVSTSVKGHDLVSGTAITLQVTDGNLSLNGGCNTMNGAATISDGVLKFSGHPMQTMMACGDGKDAQDKWLLETFTTGVSPTLSGDVMTLTHDDLTILMGPASSTTSSK